MVNQKEKQNHQITRQGFAQTTSHICSPKHLLLTSLDAASIQSLTILVRVIRLYKKLNAEIPHHQPPMTTYDYQLLDGHVKSYPIYPAYIRYCLWSHQYLVGVMQSTVVVKESTYMGNLSSFTCKYHLSASTK